MMFVTRKMLALLALASVLVIPIYAVAQGGPPNRPPAKVVAAPAHLGVLSPQAEFRGSVYFREVSDVATEVHGKVTAVFFEEGRSVSAGQLLVRLDAELLRKDLGAIEARLARDETELEDAEVRLRRSESLVQGGLATREQSDEYRFDARSLRFQLSATRAELERVEAQIAKSAIYAPFDGVVLERTTELGEWKGDGETVAVIARAHEYKIIVDIPESAVPWLELGEEVEMTIGLRTILGRIDSLIPRGDIATRTFPLKIGVESDTPLLEGMTAITRLPVGAKVSCVMVPRDALLHSDGRETVVSVRDGVAAVHSVEVIGYDGHFVGISRSDLSADESYLVMGHERVRNGDQVQVVQAPLSNSIVRDSDD